MGRIDRKKSRENRELSRLHQRPRGRIRESDKKMENQKQILDNRNDLKTVFKILSLVAVLFLIFIILSACVIIISLSILFPGTYHYAGMRTHIIIKDVNIDENELFIVIDNNPNITITNQYPIIPHSNKSKYGPFDGIHFELNKYSNSTGKHTFRLDNDGAVANYSPTFEIELVSWNNKSINGKTRKEVEIEVESRYNEERDRSVVLVNYFLEEFSVFFSNKTVEYNHIQQIEYEPTQM